MLACVTLGMACATWPKGDVSNHPAAVVGEWVDVEKSSPRDSSFWVLRPNGDDEGLRITRGPPEPEHSARRHYGYWFVRTSSGTETLCVTRRPGREPPSCTPFETTIDSTVAPPRRVMKLHAYAGAHHMGQRVLVERR
jgi:hypothetical protein